MPYNDFKNNELPQHTNLGTGYKRLFMKVQVDDILSTVDYCDTVAKQVCLVHEVGGEDDGAASLVLDQQVPDGSPGVGVHPRGGLVQDNHPVLLLLLLCPVQPPCATNLRTFGSLKTHLDPPTKAQAMLSFLCIPPERFWLCSCLLCGIP